MNDYSFEIMDGGQELYKVFLDYQALLSQGHGGTDEVRKCQADILRKGIAAIKLKDHGANTQRSTERRGSEGISKGHGSQRSSCPDKIPGPKKIRREVEAGVQHADAGLARFRKQLFTSHRVDRGHCDKFESRVWVQFYDGWLTK